MQGGLIAYGGKSHKNNRRGPRAWSADIVGKDIVGKIHILGVDRIVEMQGNALAKLAFHNYANS